MYVVEVLERCAELASRIARLYRQLAERFPGDPEREKIWRELALIEETHAEVLRQERDSFQEREESGDFLPEMGQRLDEAREALAEIEKRIAAARSIDEAAEAAIALEEVQLEELYDDLVMQGDTSFRLVVERLEASLAEKAEPSTAAAAAGAGNLEQAVWSMDAFALNVELVNDRARRPSVFLRAGRAVVRRGGALLAGCVFAVSLVGCAAKKPRSADEYFRAASQNFRSGALSVATEQFRELLDQHPFSDYAEEAELRIAHAQYLDGRYAEAIVALTDFQRRHPTSPHLPFVGYLLGMCYARQMLEIDRDQTASQNAYTYFLTVLRQYPESPFAELAREELDRCRRRLAGHELYVAEFYARRGNWKAAEVRLVELAANYGDTVEATRGLLQLARHYRQRGLHDRARLAYQAVTQLRPGSPHAVIAQRALQRLATEEPVRSADPVTVLLALNGRSRPSDLFETAQLPPLPEPRLPSRAGAMPAPALGTGFDPFGRGRSYY